MVSLKILKNDSCFCHTSLNLVRFVFLKWYSSFFVFQNSNITRFWSMPLFSYQLLRCLGLAREKSRNCLVYLKTIPTGFLKASKNRYFWYLILKSSNLKSSLTTLQKNRWQFRLGFKTQLIFFLLFDQLVSILALLALTSISESFLTSSLWN